MKLYLDNNIQFKGPDDGDHAFLVVTHDVMEESNIIIDFWRARCEGELWDMLEAEFLGEDFDDEFIKSEWIVQQASIQVKALGTI